MPDYDKQHGAVGKFAENDWLKAITRVGMAVASFLFLPILTALASYVVNDLSSGIAANVKTNEALTHAIKEITDVVAKDETYSVETRTILDALSKRIDRELALQDRVDKNQESDIDELQRTLNDMRGDARGG